MSEKSPFVPIVFILATLVCLFIAQSLPYIDANGSWHIGAVSSVTKSRLA